MSGSLRFLSHLRVGLAATLTGSPSVPNAQAAYSLSVAGVGMTGQFRLFGPGEVVALEPRSGDTEFSAACQPGP